MDYLVSKIEDLFNKPTQIDIFPKKTYRWPTGAW